MLQSYIWYNLIEKVDQFSSCMHSHAHTHVHMYTHFKNSYLFLLNKHDLVTLASFMTILSSDIMCYGGSIRSNVSTSIFLGFVLYYMPVERDSKSNGI